MKECLGVRFVGELRPSAKQRCHPWEMCSVHSVSDGQPSVCLQTMRSKPSSALQYSLRTASHTFNSVG